MSDISRNETGEFGHDDAVRDAVHDDLLQSFDQPTMWLAEPRIEVDPIGSGVLRSESHAAIAWQVSGRHAADPTGDRRRFLGLAPTGTDVVVHGVTFVRPDADMPGGLAFRRLIDWGSVYDQLGMVPGRPVDSRSETPPLEPGAASA